MRKVDIKCFTIELRACYCWCCYVCPFR